MMPLKHKQAAAALSLQIWIPSLQAKEGVQKSSSLLATARHCHSWESQHQICAEQQIALGTYLGMLSFSHAHTTGSGGAQPGQQLLAQPDSSQ